MRQQTILQGFALTVVALMSTAAVARAQPADPNYQAQQQDYQAKQQQYQQQQDQYQAKQDAYKDQKDAYAQQKAGFRAKQDVYDAQRALYLLGRAKYEERYGSGSYDEYTRTHSTTTTTVSPAGNVESRTKTTVIEH